MQEIDDEIHNYQLKCHRPIRASKPMRSAGALLRTGLPSATAFGCPSGPELALPGKAPSQTGNAPFCPRAAFPVAFGHGFANLLRKSFRRDVRCARFTRSALTCSLVARPLRSDELVASSSLILATFFVNLGTCIPYHGQ